MKTQAVILNLAVLLATPALAREKTDVVVMKNGDRMTCEVKGLDAGVLSLSLDYVDGTISVQWSKVARLESQQQFIVRTQDGTVHSGTLTTAETPTNQPVRIQIAATAEKTATIDRSQVVRMDQTSEKFWQRFNGDINFGISYSKGNQATQYSLGTQADYLRQRWAAQSTFTSNLSSNSGSTTSTRNQLGFSGYHLLRWDNYFYAGTNSFLQSSVQKIALQTTLGGGMGRFLMNTNRASIAVLGGLAWQNTNYNQSTGTTSAQNATAALIAAQLNAFKFKKTNLSANADVFPILSEPGRVRYDTNVSYYIKLLSDLSWNVSFYGSWDNRPPLNFPGSDYGSSSGLKWTFGNK